MRGFRRRGPDLGDHPDPGLAVPAGVLMMGEAATATCGLAAGFLFILGLALRERSWPLAIISLVVEAVCVVVLLWLESLMG